MRLGVTRRQVFRHGRSRKGYWHMAKTIASGARLNNKWLQEQGRVSLKGLVIKKSLWAQLAPHWLLQHGSNRLVQAIMPGGEGRRSEMAALPRILQPACANCLHLPTCLSSVVSDAPFPSPQHADQLPLEKEVDLRRKSRPALHPQGLGNKFERMDHLH